MTAAKKGDTVKVHYTGKFGDGTVFDSSKKGSPMEFILGEGKIIPELEKQVIGMNVGENRTLTLTSDQAYGPYREELIVSISRDNLPEEYKFEVGQHLKFNQQDGSEGVAKVVEVGDKEIKVDGNHPLAGKDLTFEIELVGIG